MASIPLTAEPAERKGLKDPFAAGELRALANWLLVWVVLANIGFAAMWVVGAPPRFAEIVAAAAVGLVVRKANFWVKVAAFLAVIAYSVLSFIAGLFNLVLSSLMHSVKFFLELNPSQSAEYIAGGLLLVGIVGIAMHLLRREQGFNDTRLVVAAMLAALSLGGIDGWMGQGMRGHYKRAATAGTPFTSAIEQTGFGTVMPGGERHLMLIMVESLGTPVGNREMDRLLFGRFDSFQVRNRFDLSSGVTTYYNSTTAGEIRELCGRWGDYYDVLDSRDETCLPARLAKEGYETRAYHSFTGAFFDRRQWYPNIGFQESAFAEQIFARGGVRECGGVFPGVCDRDVPALLAQDLKSAQKPQFIYWLTVNSHLPVPPGMNLDVENCDNVSVLLARDYPMICRQFALWDQLDRAIIEEITAADFPATDILIVGDHMPPYFDRHHRSQFAPDRVPWLLLEWKGVSDSAVEYAKVVNDGNGINDEAG